jgi:hypothetical protein
VAGAMTIPYIQAVSDTFRTIEGRPILWTDEAGVIHRCEGADIMEDVRILWTYCGRDVPADAAYLPGDGDAVTCSVCRAVAAVAAGEDQPVPAGCRTVDDVPFLL